MLLPQRSLGRFPKRGTRTAKLKKPNDKASSIGGQARGAPLQIALHPDDPTSIRVVQRGSTGLRIYAFVPSYRPLSAVKSIAKTTWQVLPAGRRQDFDRLRRWIKDPSDAVTSELFLYFVPGPGLRHVALGVWEATQPGYSRLVTLLAVGNTVIAWPLPDFQNVGDKRALLPLMPCSPVPPYLPAGERRIIESDDPTKEVTVHWDLRSRGALLQSTASPIPVVLSHRGPNGRTKALQASVATPSNQSRDSLVHILSGGTLWGELRLTTRLPRGITDLLPILPEGAHDPSLVLETLEFFHALHEGGELQIIDTATRNIHVRTRLQPADREIIEHLEELIRFVRWVKLIGAHHHLPLLWSSTFTQEDLRSIELLGCQLDQVNIREVGPHSHTLTCDKKEGLEAVVEETTKHQRDLDIRRDLTLPLDGHQVPLGIVDAVMEKVTPKPGAGPVAVGGVFHLAIECESILYLFAEDETAPSEEGE